MAELPLIQTGRKEIGGYVDYLLRKQRSPKTITCHLQTIRLFFDYLINDEGEAIVNPVTRVSIRLPKASPPALQGYQVDRLLTVITDLRDMAMFMVMLRCGLRVEEVSRLAVDVVNFSKTAVCCEGKRRQGPSCLPQ